MCDRSPVLWLAVFPSLCIQRSLHQSRHSFNCSDEGGIHRRQRRAPLSQQTQQRLPDPEEVDPLRDAEKGSDDQCTARGALQERRRALAHHDAPAKARGRNKALRGPSNIWKH